jgi:hypothetical protein
MAWRQWRNVEGTAQNIPVINSFAAVFCRFFAMMHARFSTTALQNNTASIQERGQIELV